MVYVNNTKIKNTEDIIECLTKRDEILEVISVCLTIRFNEPPRSENVLYNIVDDLKGHQDIVDLENEIIRLCNVTVNTHEFDGSLLIEELEA